MVTIESRPIFSSKVRVAYVQACDRRRSLAQVHSLKGWIPAGYTILGRAAADISGDGQMDQIIVLRNPYEKIVDDTTRPLLVLAGNGKGGFRLLARNGFDFAGL